MPPEFYETHCSFAELTEHLELFAGTGDAGLGWPMIGSWIASTRLDRV